MYRYENAVTIAVTIRVMTSTMMVFRRSMKGTGSLNKLNKLAQ
jgi:hypothetical protein